VLPAWYGSKKLLWPAVNPTLAGENLTIWALYRLKKPALAEPVPQKAFPTALIPGLNRTRRGCQAQAQAGLGPTGYGAAPTSAAAAAAVGVETFVAADEAGENRENMRRKVLVRPARETG
jgi:hypothetical protein